MMSLLVHPVTFDHIQAVSEARNCDTVVCFGDAKNIEKTEFGRVLIRLGGLKLQEAIKKRGYYDDTPLDTTSIDELPFRRIVFIPLLPYSQHTPLYTHAFNELAKLKAINVILPIIEKGTTTCPCWILTAIRHQETYGAIESISLYDPKDMFPVKASIKVGTRFPVDLHVQRLPGNRVVRCDDCPDALFNVETDDNVIMKGCDHAFHQACIRDLLTDDLSCPVCEVEHSNGEKRKYRIVGCPPPPPPEGANFPKRIRRA